MLTQNFCQPIYEHIFPPTRDFQANGSKYKTKKVPGTKLKSFKGKYPDGYQCTGF